MSYKTHSTRRPSPPSASDELAYAESSRARCAAGDHQVREVPANKVVYGPYGARRRTGERYCTACQMPVPVP